MHAAGAVDLVERAEIERGEGCGDGLVAAGHRAERIGLRDRAERWARGRRSDRVGAGWLKLAAEIEADEAADEAVGAAGDRAGRVGLIDRAEVEADKAADEAAVAADNIAVGIGQRDRAMLMPTKPPDCDRVAVLDVTFPFAEDWEIEPSDVGARKAADCKASISASRYDRAGCVRIGNAYWC